MPMTNDAVRVCATCQRFLIVRMGIVGHDNEVIASREQDACIVDVTDNEDGSQDTTWRPVVNKDTDTCDEWVNREPMVMTCALLVPKANPSAEGGGRG